SVTSLVSMGSPYATFFNQARWALIGLPLLFIASRIPPGTYQRLAWPILAVAIVLQLLVFTPLGVDVNGNGHRIQVARQRFQPPDSRKLALICWLAAVCSRTRALRASWTHVAIPAVPVGGVALRVVLYGHDLGTAMVIMAAVAG